MAQHVTIVYYSTNDNREGLDAFHVTSINSRRLQAAFNSHEIHTIKHITIENEALYSKSFKTLFSESDIKTFIDTWKINF